jgi:hypothetical protein
MSGLSKRPTQVPMVLASSLVLIILSNVQGYAWGLLTPLQTRNGQPIRRTFAISSRQATVLGATNVSREGDKSVSNLAPTSHSSRVGWTGTLAYNRCATRRSSSHFRSAQLTLYAKQDDDDDDEGDVKSGDKSKGGKGSEGYVNPYADPNYPDLEFVDYSDPEYSADAGADIWLDSPTSSDDASSENAALDAAAIEGMREERRRRNDEYQFQSFYKECCLDGAEYYGEWTCYQVNMVSGSQGASQGSGGDDGFVPQLRQWRNTIPVISQAQKYTIEGTAEAAESIQDDNYHSPTDMERIKFVSRVFEELSLDLDTDDSTDASTPQSMEDKWVQQSYCPSPLQPRNFRGADGIMCVGNAYTLSTATPMSSQGSDSSAKTVDSKTTGPFSDYRVELGMQVDSIRFRVQLTYALANANSKSASSADSTSSSSRSGSDGLNDATLYLNTLIVARERQGTWPRSTTPDTIRTREEQEIQQALFGPMGAPGGLYDPPPLGSPDHAPYYLFIDLPGQASILFPYLLLQDSSASSESESSSGSTPKVNGGWVTSLDWTPGKMRYQVDRKVHGGSGLLNLRTLELSQVQSMDAEQYRPRDGGQNMRQ